MVILGTYFTIRSSSFLDPTLFRTPALHPFDYLVTTSQLAAISGILTICELSASLPMARSSLYQHMEMVSSGFTHCRSSVVNLRMQPKSLDFLRLCSCCVYHTRVNLCSRLVEAYGQFLLFPNTIVG